MLTTTSTAGSSISAETDGYALMPVELASVAADSAFRSAQPTSLSVA